MGDMGRVQLLSTQSGIVEDITCGLGRRHSSENFSPAFQISFPYRGVFIWHVGRDDVVGDANQILFVTGGEPFRLSEPRLCGYAELILTPALSVLCEMAESTGFDLVHHPLFRARSRRAPPVVQHACARLLHETSMEGGLDVFAAEEDMLALLRASLEIEPTRSEASRPTRRLIRRAKEFLESEFTRLGRPPRISPTSSGASRVCHCSGTSRSFASRVRWLTCRTPRI